MNPHRPFTRDLPLVLLIAFLTGITAFSAARADILALDWSHLSAAYQSGAMNSGTPQNFTVGSNTVSTVFAVQGNTTASSIFLGATPTVATNGGTAPNSALYTTGGLTDGELALQIGIAVPDTTTEGVVFTLNFSQAVYGVTFKLFDLDYGSGSFTDQVRNILGVNGAATVMPTLTGSTDNSVAGAAGGFQNSVTGTVASGQTAGTANVTVSFSNTVPITSVSFVYGDNSNSALGAVAPASTTQQIIGVGNIVWATNAGEQVPEPGMFGVTGLGLAAMLTVTLRRRR